MSVVTSRDNPRVRRWRDLLRDARLRRSERAAILEGEHLVSACLQSGRPLAALLLSQSASDRPGTAALVRAAGLAPVILSDAVFSALVDVATPAGIAAEIALPGGASDWRAAAACVFLEGIQDAGNVGTLLRSAAAFGISHAVLGRGCADAWSPKVLRAGMGAHFSLALAEQADLDAVLGEFEGRIACAVPRGGTSLPEADLSGRIGWLFGSEGRGVSPALASRADLRVTIPMRGETESLNVAAAAAICLYELNRRAGRA
jgi:TrmH family RNA methyltransferase